MTSSSFDRWISQYTQSGSFKEDNRTSEQSEQKELIKLRKENQRLNMENDILKQAELIIGRK
ncbi:hypothetical protein BN982_03716 [Halobacillus karajensis]|nr:hypothetical protein BN982_03716 [Halobacillus karajensis]